MPHEVTRAATCFDHNAPESHMARTNPFTFLQQVRSEVRKVVWPSRNEVVISTIMVLVMVLLASLFFLSADQVISWAVESLLTLG